MLENAGNKLQSFEFYCWFYVCEKLIESILQVSNYWIHWINLAHTTYLMLPKNKTKKSFNGLMEQYNAVSTIIFKLFASVIKFNWKKKPFSKTELIAMTRQWHSHSRQRFLFLWIWTNMANHGRLSIFLI